MDLEPLYYTWFRACRVFWRRVGHNGSEKNDTKETSMRITGLKDDLTYELVIKAGNAKGMSTLTEPIRFTTTEKDVTSAASLGEFILLVRSKEPKKAYKLLTCFFFFCIFGIC